MTEFARREQRAPAKVNLFLHVLERRADGYHELDSLAVFAAVADTIRAEPADSLTLTILGPFAAQLGADSDNLVLRAARLLAEAAGRVPCARLVLRKELPVASGLGGGSADAAATLRALATLWGISADLLALARRLGADVPVCVASTPARMRGTGEALSAAPVLPRCGLVLINPGVGVSTAEVFRARSGPFSAPAVLVPRWADAITMAADLAILRNDLEIPAIALCPSIGHVLAALRQTPGCLLARMSGSGGTCFGLFAAEEAARAAAQHLSLPGWWSWGGALAGAL